jgi:membrane protease YdiL (CAAX protease family)
MDANPRERLQRADLRFLAICLAVFALTTWFSVRYFYRAFPEASIDFRVNREQSLDLARRFLESRGFVATSYRHASRFQFDNEAKTFLERELGLEKANQLMGSEVKLWRWSHRWFRPLQKEEFTVDITPRGEVAGFAHLIAEADSRPSVTQAQGRGLAEQFLRDAMNRDLGGLEFVEGSSTVRQARTDHVFTWQERDFNVHDSRYRFEVTVLGSEIGGFREYLKVPETWARGYESLRSRNEAAQVVDTALLVLLMVGLLGTLVIAIRRHDVRWRQAVIVGSIGATLLFLSNWNAFPLTEFGYPTTDSYQSFLTQEFVHSLLSALGAGLLLALLTAAAEPLYREFLGSQISLGNLFTLRGLRTKSFLRGSVLGIALTGIFVAYQIAFYIGAYKFGAWSPADVPYDDLLNTRFPWLFVLFAGFFPAVSEEFLFRMFAIPFFKKLVRFTWLALVLAGFIWGFGHAGYPQQPFWIRGIEVGISGVALGFVMLRWGILPTLV